MCCQFDQLDLRQFQRQGSRSLLSLGTIFADVHITDQKADVVPVRPHRCTLHPQISLPVPVQCLFKWQISRTWLVYDLQAFFTAGQSLVNLCNDPIDLFDKFFWQSAFLHIVPSAAPIFPVYPKDLSFRRN